MQFSDSSLNLFSWFVKTASFHSGLQEGILYFIALWRNVSFCLLWTSPAVWVESHEPVLEMQWALVHICSYCKKKFINQHLKGENLNHVINFIVQSEPFYFPKILYREHGKRGKVCTVPITYLLCHSYCTNLAFSFFYSLICFCWEKHLFNWRLSLNKACYWLPMLIIPGILLLIWKICLLLFGLFLCW